MEYKDIFRPETLAKLSKKSQENLKTMLGDKTLMQTMIQSQQLLDDISTAETPFKDQLEELAKEMVEKLYPIIEEEGIKLDAKIVGMSDVNSTLDEIKVNKPGLNFPIKIETIEEAQRIGKELINQGYTWYFRDKINLTIPPFSFSNFGPFQINLEDQKNKIIDFDPISVRGLEESITPKSRRRIINAVTQGAALRGAFSFYLFKDYLDAIDSSLIDKYNQIMKNSFGVYDDDNAIAMMLSALAQGQKVAGGSSKVIINEIKVNKPGIKYPIKIDNHEELKKWIYDVDYKGVNPTRTMKFPFYIYHTKLGDLNHYSFHSNLKPLNERQESGITIQARALNFPMLVHELIKGLYELVSLQGFKGDKEANQGVVDKVDKLKHEPEDIKYGKFIYDALNDIFAESPYSDPRIREFFFTEVYQLDDNEFLEFVENAINEELSPSQTKWVNQTLKEISIDLKSDDYDQEGIDEIKINKPDHYVNWNDREWYNYLSKSEIPFNKIRKTLSKEFKWREGTPGTFINTLSPGDKTKIYNLFK